MPQPKKAGRFGGTAAHHNLIMANLATELIRHGRIRTTYARAKTVQPLAERMITFAKRGDIHARRQVLQVIRDKDVVHKLFTDVGPAFEQRPGGYTRVLKLGPRKGDAAPMALIELVEGIEVAGASGLEEAPKRRWGLRRRRGTQSTAARERAEQRAAAEDRGEEPEFEAPESAEPAESADDAAPAPRRPAAPADRADADEGEEGPQVDPAEVEARLAAEEEAEAAAADDAAADDADDADVADDAEASGDETRRSDEADDER